MAAGFAEGGVADALAPGARLAGLMAAVTGTDGAVLATLTDQEVLGVLGAAQKLACWAAWSELLALAEFSRRRPASATGIAGARGAAEEAAWKSAEQWSRMMNQMVRATMLAARLPQTMAALRQGLLSDYKVRIIEAQTADLTAEDVAKADVMLAAAGQVKNPNGLRDYARRQVARLDPEAAARRKERGRRDAYVRAWQEDSGNMGLSAREMPNGDGLVAWQNIEKRALELYAAGVEGTTGQLQVQAMLDFLLGRATPSKDACENTEKGAHQDTHDTGHQDTDEDSYRDMCEGAHQDTRADGLSVGESARPSAHDGKDRDARENAHKDKYSSPRVGVHDGGEDIKDGNAGEGEGAYQDTRVDENEDASEGAYLNARTSGRGGGRGGWICNPILVVPWDPALGRPSGPAELPGYGLVDEGDTMDLLQAAGENPDSRWCLTLTDPKDGTAVAHGCVPGPHTLDGIITGGRAAGDDGAVTAADLAAAFNVKLASIAKGACQHAHAEPGYRPSRKLRHLVMARNNRCTAPGCGRPAAACDQDHTTPWDDGGITCECDLAPLCRHHHQVKQAQGWALEQPEPGVLIWTTPAGLSRTTTPTIYGA